MSETLCMMQDGNSCQINAISGTLHQSGLGLEEHHTLFGVCQMTSPKDSQSMREMTVLSDEAIILLQALLIIC